MKKQLILLVMAGVCLLSLFACTQVEKAPSLPPISLETPSAELDFGKNGKMMFQISGDDTGGKIEKLTITNANAQLINEIDFKECTVFGEPIAASILEYDIMDLNFDGFEDFLIYDQPNGTWNQHYLYFVWDRRQGNFVQDSQLSDLGLLEFDQENKVIYATVRGSAADHWYSTYVYDGGFLTVQEQSSENAVVFIDNLPAEFLPGLISEWKQYPDAIMLYKETRDYRGAEIEISKAGYCLYDVDTDKIVAEFSANSEQGESLKLVINWPLMELEI